MIGYGPKFVNVRVLSHGASSEKGSGDDEFYALYRARTEGEIRAAYYIPDVDQAGDDTDYKTLKIINKGTDGTGTTLMASYALTASNAVSACVPMAFTLSTTEANKKTSAGELLAFGTTESGSGIALVSGIVQLQMY